MVHSADTIYVLEFKLNRGVDTALEQIKAQGYATPYLRQGKARQSVSIVGLNFGSEQKVVDQWQEEVML